MHPLNILLVYGTTEGQTRRIAERAAAQVCKRGHQAVLRDSAATASDPDLESFDAFIVAASVHQRQHQETIEAFVAAHRRLLNAKPSVFISVSLSAAMEEGQAEAQEYVDGFLFAADWRPSMTLRLAGALRLTEYDYFQEQIVKFIVLKGGSVAITGRDREFTDWNALSGFVDRFLDQLATDRSALYPRVSGLG